LDHIVSSNPLFSFKNQAHLRMRSRALARSASTFL
jgi:hypothetical protein